MTSAVFPCVCAHIACKIFQDQTRFMDTICQLHQTLNVFPGGRTAQTRRFLRSNRNVAFMRQTSYFETLGQLGSGGFGSVELVRTKATIDPNPERKMYAIKTVYPKSASRRIRGQLLAKIERDAAIIGSHCPFILSYKGAWIESNYSDRPDSYKFLMPVMKYGDFHEVLEQLHPFVLRLKPFSFHPLTAHRSSFEGARSVRHNVSITLLGELSGIRSAGKENLFRTIYVKYMMQMVSAISYLHRHDIVHCDIKIENLLVGEDLKIKVADLGLSTHHHYSHFYSYEKWMTDPCASTMSAEEYQIMRCSPQSLRERARVKKRERGDITRLGGTRLYKAPEQFPGWVDAKEGRHGRVFRHYRHKPSDWYAVGMVLFEMVTGRQILQLSKILYPECLEGVAGTDDRNVWETYLKLDDSRIPLFQDRHRATVQTLLLDMRFLSVVKKFMKSDPSERLNDYSLNSDEDYRSLTDGISLEGPMDWTWNEFLVNPRIPVVTRLVSSAESFVFSDPGTRFPVALVGGIGFMSDSPGIVASPGPSPMKRMRRRRLGHPTGSDSPPAAMASAAAAPAGPHVPSGSPPAAAAEPHVISEAESALGLFDL